ncbi:tetratricopeptide repeat protein [Microbacterium gorillae]|uniref:tetratricopeptide repeat protein n=1 Tax=Microbacterium gorillae TaxID=1231063 RepID=UPI00058DB963|nr:tetratricopeptide repeat protein [Microbacterium gorillae]
MSDVNPAMMRGAVDLSSLRNRPEPGSPAAQASTMPVVQHVEDADFQRILDLSRRVPVVVYLWTEAAEQRVQLAPVLEQVVASAGGRLLLAEVDIAANPQITSAFGVTADAAPLVVALVAGQPVPLFNDAAQEAQVVQVLGQLLQVAQQQGVSGAITPAAAESADGEEPAEAPIPPLHAEAYDAIEAGDYDRAVNAYEKALAENPKDADARAGLGQVKLLQRTQGVDLQAVRDAAAQHPQDVDKQFAVADMDIAGGHVDDAFERLLDLFAALPSDERTPVRERLVELFGLVGDDDSRVIRARGRLASLLF